MNDPPKHWDEKRKAFLQWERWGNDIVSPNRCVITKESGETAVVLKHHTSSMVQVRNGPFFTGREWFVVEGQEKEHHSFDEAFAAAFAKKEDP